jgi:flavin-dependent dehydrogenase
MSPEFDVAIVGAGPAGAAAARRLAQRGCRVVLLERTHFDLPRVGESLAPAIQPLLMDLGIWSEFMALSPLPSYGTRSAWGGADTQDYSHLMSPYGCGWHVDRSAFDRTLAETAVTAGAELRCGCVLGSCEATADGRWLLQFDQQETNDSTLVHARVLIDASGRGANLARRLGARRASFDRLVGVATLLGEVDASREGYILVESTPEGWWYTAPVPRDRMMTMLMTDSDLCGRAKLSVRTRWRELLAFAPTTAARVSGTVLWGPQIVSALSQRLRRSGRDARWIAIGDAALAVDPISGSGVIRALRSARAGADTALALLHDDEIWPHIEAYEAACDLECTAYLEERARYYGVEQRWPDQPFWQRRVEAIPRVAM